MEAIYLSLLIWRDL